MALNNTNYGRDAVYINGLLLENQSGLNGHYFTLSTEGRDVVTIDQETGQYEPKVITVHYAIDGTTAASFNDNLNYLQHLLNRKDADISFNDEYDLFMIGDIKNLGLDEKYATWGLGSYEITCENPFKYSKTVSEITATKVAEGEQNFSINYSGTASTQPIVEVVPGASQTASIYPRDANLEFINILNQKNNKNLSIGSSYPDGDTTQICNYNFNTVNYTNIINDGWTGDQSYIYMTSKTDSYANKGSGLSYRVLYPLSYNSSGTEDPDDPSASNIALSKSISSAMTNFVASYGVRMWASNILAGGSLKLSALTTDGRLTGVVIYKNSVDNLKGKVLYYVDNQIMGSDTIDLSQYSHTLGLTDRQTAIISKNGKNYFQDDIVNAKRSSLPIVEQKVSAAGYIYTPANNNVVFSKLGETYTFKVGNLPTRRFNYARENGTAVSHNVLQIGFKPNMVGPSYPNLELQITGIDVLQVEKSNLLNNWGILTAGNTFTVNPANLDLYRCRQNSGEGIYSPEYIGLYNAEDSLVISSGSITNFQCWYYNRTSGNDPQIKVKYNTVYL